ncbi:hypothetical protein R3P38DRAFT_2786484 [Favolaschia claudopus]|uniref:Uncharacterized protein n=1 Tax=Favolaschia claudopus TaxID=2862362 RepID=A0AAW0ARV7_9AGAR
MAPDYDQQLKAFELRLARTEQVHSCQVRRCLIVGKSGGLRCKRRAPFTCHEKDFIDEGGNWGQRRVYEYMNGWIPGILVNVRCNNDAKLLTNGRDTMNTTFYVAGYAAKPQHNISAVLAKGYAVHLARLAQGNNTIQAEVDGLRNQQRLLLFRLVHAINREQELGAPMVISYLMGWGDTYCSHHYTAIYWSSFVGALLKAFPLLQSSRSAASSVPASQNDSESNDETVQETNGQPEDTDETEAQQAEDGNDIVTLGVDSTGQLFAKCQVTDYLARGDELSGYNLVDFFVDTYEVEFSQKDRLSGDASATTESEDHSETPIGDEKRRPGRPKGVRSRQQGILFRVYAGSVETLAESPNGSKKC